MSWEAFEWDPPGVVAALRRGEFDYVEVVGALEETRFFEMLLGHRILDALAAAYPTPRRKEEVPLWLYLASELTLRLHGATGFAAYPYIIHCGGLLRALGPERVQGVRDPTTGQVRLAVRGYNAKNAYTRRTPCDQDFLRKLARDTDPDRLEAWFGGEVVKQYQALGAYDAEGIFIADGTYLFVPLNNDRYEGSSVLRFDAHNHVVSKERYAAMSDPEQRACRWRRAYRAMTLSHTTRARDYSLRCGVHVMPGSASESPQTRPLVERFVNAVGRGVMKLLIHDRGLIDGETVTALKRLGVDSLFPLKTGMDAWEDAKALEEGRTWTRYDLPAPVAAPVPPERPEAIRQREAVRQRTLQKRQAQGPPAPPRRRLAWIESLWTEPGRVWESCRTPVGVLRVRHHYDTGECGEWALASTRRFDDPLELWKLYEVRPAIEEDHRQEKCFWDMTHGRSTALSLIVNQVVFVQLAYSLIQIFLRKIERQELVGRTRQRLLDQLLPTRDQIALYHQQRYGLLDFHAYQELLLTLGEGARRKVLGKTRRLRRAQASPLELPWRPDPLEE